MTDKKFLTPVEGVATVDFDQIDPDKKKFFIYPAAEVEEFVKLQYSQGEALRAFKNNFSGFAKIFTEEIKEIKACLQHLESGDHISKVTASIERLEIRMDCFEALLGEYFKVDECK